MNKGTVLRQHQTVLTDVVDHKWDPEKQKWLRRVIRHSGECRVTVDEIELLAKLGSKAVKSKGRKSKLGPITVVAFNVRKTILENWN